MQEKIREEWQHLGEEEDYTQENIESYETFKNTIEGIVYASNLEDFSKEDIIEQIKEELESLDRVLR